MFQDLDHPLLPNQDFMVFFGGGINFQASILREFLVAACLHLWEPQIDSPTCDTFDGSEIPRPTT